MSLIVLTVKPSLNRWAVIHNDVTVATFCTRQEAEKAALALGVHHPKRDTAEIDLTGEDGVASAIRIF